MPCDAIFFGALHMEKTASYAEQPFCVIIHVLLCRIKPEKKPPLTNNRGGLSMFISESDSVYEAGKISKELPFLLLRTSRFSQLQPSREP